MSSWYNIIKLADYEKYREQIEEFAANNPRPFAHWLGEDRRAYFPFRMSNEGQQIDPEIGMFLQQEGCEVTDYRGGHCTRGGRDYRIGKLIQQAYKRDMKILQDRMNSTYDDQGRDQLQNQEIELNKKYNNLMNLFSTSSIRNMKDEGNEFLIVLSDLPKDIAMMSTDRGWTSCMNLDEGAQADDVYCEVEQGGIVAYLIGANDKDIKNPYARLLIKRFDNKAGQSYAIPEKKVYGNTVPGFAEEVQDVINKLQGDIPVGYYDLSGNYSDTLAENKLIGPKSKQEVIEWLYSDELKVDIEGNYLYKKLGKPKNQVTEQVIKDQREHAADIIGKSSKGTYPDKVIKDIIDDIVGTRGRMLCGAEAVFNLMKNYNYMFDEAKVEKMPLSYRYEYIKTMPPEQRQEKIAEKNESAIRLFDAFERGAFDEDIKDFSFQLDELDDIHGYGSREYKNKLEEMVWYLGGKLSERVVGPVEYLQDEIPQDIINGLATFANNLEEKMTEAGIPSEVMDKYKPVAPIRAMTLNLFNEKGAKDYKHLRYLFDSMSDYDEYYIGPMTVGERFPPINIDTVGKSVKTLGVMAREIKPHLEKYKSELERELRKHREGNHYHRAITLQISKYEKAIANLDKKGNNWYKSQGNNNAQLV